MSRLKCMSESYQNQCYHFFLKLRENAPIPVLMDTRELDEPVIDFLPHAHLYGGMKGKHKIHLQTTFLHET